MMSCLEIKHLLNGTNRQYPCELIHYRQKFGILKYILESTVKVSTLTLSTGTVTYAFYWSERPYTLYRWYHDGKYLGSYFNVADQIVIKKNIIEWLDLAVDILVLPDNILEVLDEDELPESISLQLKQYINSTKEFIVHNYNSILDETDKILHRLSVIN